jgi:hypothetical protein
MASATLNSCRARTERLFYSFPKANEAAPPWRALEPSVREAVGGRFDGPSMRVARPKPGYTV